ncbi:hypothetical protein CSA80_03380 [Candidatus Saccharibacteria bacterium]|nr:MAG: hypothetical protein CSA80_03380 [Candidatus Saccharibacteria bacterium]
MNNEQNPQEVTTQPQNTTQSLQPRPAGSVQPPAPQASPAQAQPQSLTQVQQPQPLQPVQSQPQSLQPSQPPVVQNPAVSPNPQQATGVVNGAPVAAGPVFSNSQSMQQETKRKLPKWAIITLSVFLFIAVAIAVIVLVFLARFSTYTYEDDNGTRYSLKYYKGSTIKSTSETPRDNEPGRFPSKFLTAPSGKYPLGISITKKRENSSSLYSDQNNSLCKDPAFKLDSPADGQSDIVCHINVGDKEVVYFYEISDGDDKHLVIIMQEVDLVVPKNEKEAYIDRLLKDPDRNLRDFNNDLQFILPSIKVIH